MSSTVQLFLIAPYVHVHKDVVEDAKKNWSMPMPKPEQVAATIKMTEKLHCSQLAQQLLDTILLQANNDRPKYDRIDFTLKPAPDLPDLPAKEVVGTAIAHALKKARNGR